MGIPPHPTHFVRFFPSLLTPATSLVVTVSGAGDASRAVTVQGTKAITHVRPLQTCTLIVAQSRSVNTATAAPAIDRAAALVDGGTRDSTCLGRQGTFGSHIAGWWTRV